jgi:hypothetical protein
VNGTYPAAERTLQALGIASRSFLTRALEQAIRMLIKISDKTKDLKLESTCPLAAACKHTTKGSALYIPMLCSNDGHQPHRTTATQWLFAAREQNRGTASHRRLWSVQVL